MRYSVIIPVYNAEKTLHRCLNSIAVQLRDDVEILLIDDGSSDKSLQICNNYSVEHHQFVVVHQDNTGVSSARNRGLEMAQGEYVLFVDSDDYVSDSYFSAIDKLLSDKSVDFVRFGSHHFGSRNFTSIIKNGEWKSDEIPHIISEWMKGQVLNSLWSKVFCRDVIEKYNLRFNEALSISEDLSFVFSYSMYAKHVVCCSDVLYYVSEENVNSLSRKPIDQLPQKLIQADATMRANLESADISISKKKQYLQALARNYYRSAYSASKQLLKNAKSSKERRKEIRKICSVFSDGRINPGNAENFVIAIPVMFRMSILIDYLISH